MTKRKQTNSIEQVKKCTVREFMENQIQELKMKLDYVEAENNNLKDVVMEQAEIIQEQNKKVRKLDLLYPDENLPSFSLTDLYAIEELPMFIWGVNETE